jgi:hypothetical protein
LTEKQVDTIVSNLEDGLTRVKIEGGEVYVKRPLFYHTIKAFRERFGDKIELRVNTNGVAFYENRDSIIKEADYLHKLGVNRLRISLDKFHEDGGADLKKVASISEVLKEINHPLEVRYMSLDQALAIGNAENLPEHQKEKKKCMNGSWCLEEPYFFTDIKGNLYTCCWRLIPPIGNLLKSRLGELYSNMNDLQKKLLVGDLSPIQKNADLKLIQKEKGDCMLCKAVFRHGKE